MNISGKTGRLHHEIVSGMGSHQGHTSSPTHRSRTDPSIQFYRHGNIRADGVGVEFRRRVGRKPDILT